MSDLGVDPGQGSGLVGRPRDRRQHWNVTSGVDGGVVLRLNAPRAHCAVSVQENRPVLGVRHGTEWRDGHGVCRPLSRDLEIQAHTCPYVRI